MIRKIAAMADPRTVRSMSRATGRVLQGSRKTPIGLAAGRVGQSIVSVPRPPVINRTRPTAKTPRVTGGDTIDSIAPQAYKNNHWRYYSKVGPQLILFLNTPKGDPFMFDKHGHRKNVTPNLLGRLRVSPNWRRISLRLRRKNFHTWDAYQKRLTAFRRLKGSTLNQALTNIDQKVERYGRGNLQALNNVPMSRLIYWAHKTNWMGPNGPPYVRNVHDKIWRRYGSGRPLTKNQILENISLLGVFN